MMDKVPTSETREKKSCPRKLDLNAPFLSTRRPSGLTAIELPRLNTRRSSWDTSNRVPFSWEQSPGKPKGGLKIYDSRDVEVPPPKPPPGRWHPLMDSATNRNDHGHGHGVDDHNHDEVDDGFDGDVDDDYAIDIFSLSESIDIFENVGTTNFNSTRESSAIHSPSFIIQRYLSDAKALAAASGAILPVEINHNHNVSRSVGSSFASPKSCGLDMFFPWRMKHKLCDVKSPVKFARRKHKCSLPKNGFDSCH